MSLSYNPSRNAIAGDPWDVAFLSDRDVSSRVPIDFVPHPGIYITAACFSDGVYSDDAAQTCLSNLLASEIRRFVFDLYWDPINRNYGLCPVQIPRKYTNTTTSGDAAASQIPSTNSKSSTQIPSSTVDIRLRQATSISGSIAGNSSSPTPPSTPTNTEPPITTTTSTSGNTLVQLGNYQCSPDLDIDSISSLFNGFVQQTSTTLYARLQILVFNLHAAASYNTPNSPAASLTAAQLPQPKEALSTHFGDIDQYFYTPPELESDRKNLNASWYRRAHADELPISSYFTTETLSNGVVQTPDGWPSEDYVQINLGRRIVGGLGEIDPQMSGYDTQDDASLLFPPGELSKDQFVLFDTAAGVNAGCYYNPTETSISQVNNSWAVSTMPGVDITLLGFAADNLTVCGISPLLNSTLNGMTADADPDLYQDYGNQALFSWASDEPKNASSIGSSDSDGQFRCALMVSTDAYKGHWRVADCREVHRTACREIEQPYLWHLSREATSFENGARACTGNSTFSVPHTGLENTYLYHQIITDANQQTQPSFLDGVWVNFNSLAVESCWITSGPNGTCPYDRDEKAIRQRQILVPTIGALIVLILTVLTILVKCNANRRNSRIRKRGEGGWDYEGVPS